MGHPFGHPLRPWLLFGSFSVPLWSCSGLLFQLMQASSFKGNRSSIISMIWLCFRYHFCDFFFSILSIRACECTEAERACCVAEAAPQARHKHHLGSIFCSSFVAEYHLGLTSALQHCQHNGAFRFLAAQVSIDFGRISGPPFGCFWPTLAQQLCFWHACLQVAFFKDFGVRIWMSGAPESSIWCGRYCKNKLFTYVGMFLYGFRWFWDQF